MEFVLPAGSWEKIRRRKERLKEIKKKNFTYHWHHIWVMGYG